MKLTLENKTKSQEDLILTMRVCIMKFMYIDHRRILGNIKHVKQHIMDQQMEVSNKTFSLMGTVINDLNETKGQLNDTKSRLNDTETRVKILGSFRDYIKIFIIRKVERELDKSEWYEAKKMLYSRSEFLKQGFELEEPDDNIKKLDGFLYDNYNITMDEIELLLEMRDKSNRAFHDNEKSIEQAKALLKEQFPDDLQKYKDRYQKFSVFLIGNRFGGSFVQFRLLFGRTT